MKDRVIVIDPVDECLPLDFRHSLPVYVWRLGRVEF